MNAKGVVCDIYIVLSRQRHKCLSFDLSAVHTALHLVLVKRQKSDPLWSELDELSYLSQLAVYCAFSALHKTSFNILTLSQKLRIVFIFF